MDFERDWILRVHIESARLLRKYFENAKVYSEAQIANIEIARGYFESAGAYFEDGGGVREPQGRVGGVEAQCRRSVEGEGRSWFVAAAGPPQTQSSGDPAPHKFCKLTWKPCKSKIY